MFLSHIDVSLPLFPHPFQPIDVSLTLMFLFLSFPLFPSLKKWEEKEEDEEGEEEGEEEKETAFKAICKSKVTLYGSNDHRCLCQCQNKQAFALARASFSIKVFKESNFSNFRENWNPFSLCHLKRTLHPWTN